MPTFAWVRRTQGRLERSLRDGPPRGRGAAGVVAATEARGAVREAKWTETREERNWLRWFPTLSAGPFGPSKGRDGAKRTAEEAEDRGERECQI